ncbi:uncharacterized protein CIMG_13533 [Coccidioides immitis RS]|uniref:HNH nuclease domain-containing protein n=1 Tax=Coccidioides immitis (strain RS) TaxID=246410 RepID=J3K0P7_COCIM|nr:uncharacterized protein CIMG_13533 [Coccidioides immitis RS]EAS27439.3 hypothetical protein CIMG_13533 [Coccidioides immitis RS]
MNTGSSSIHTFCAGVYVLYIPCSEDIRDEGHHSQLQLAYQLLWLKMWLEYPTRQPVLHHNCLVRDHNLYVVRRVFDWTEVSERFKQDPSNPKLEVTHIPHSVMLAIVTVDGELQLVRICNIYKELDIDCPSNALILTPEAHRVFSNFQMSFEATDAKHAYKVVHQMTGFHYLQSASKKSLAPLTKSHH